MDKIAIYAAIGLVVGLVIAYQLRPLAKSKREALVNGGVGVLICTFLGALFGVPLI